MKTFVKTVIYIAILVIALFLGMYVGDSAVEAFYRTDSNSKQNQIDSLKSLNERLQSELDSVKGQLEAFEEFTIDRLPVNG